MHIAAVCEIEETLVPALQSCTTRSRRSAKRSTTSSRLAEPISRTRPPHIGQEFSGYVTQVARGIVRVKPRSRTFACLPEAGTAVGTVRTSMFLKKPSSYFRASTQEGL